MVRSISHLRALRFLLVRSRNFWLSFSTGTVVGRKVSLSLSSRIRPGRRGSIRIGDRSLVAFKALIYTRDPLTGEDRPVTIGTNCFIGGGSTITPGVTVENGSIVAAGAVVFEDVPAGCAVGGNPAKVIRRNLNLGQWGRMEGADETAARLWSQTGS